MLYLFLQRVYRNVYEGMNDGGRFCGSMEKRGVCSLLTERKTGRAPPGRCRGCHGSGSYFFIHWPEGDWTKWPGLVF